MPRSLLPETRVHAAIRDKVATHHHDIITEVEAAITGHAVVVVGMKQNPHPKRARKLLTAKGVAFHYLEYGSYVGGWRPRTALKMWAGWPTFPMVFVKGTLIGGADDLAGLIASGELDRVLAA